MYKVIKYKYVGLLGICLAATSCKVPAILSVSNANKLPNTFAEGNDSTNTGNKQWRTFFTDPNLVSLIDTALQNNQELLITLQEVEIAKSEIRVRKGDILPTVGARIGAGVDKVGRYTSSGAGDASTDIEPGKPVPDALTDFSVALDARWEIDIWHKLHNAKKAAITRYLATIEGKNFVLSNLIAEVANSYYELLALDNQLLIVQENIKLQNNALEVIKIQKEGARVTELAVQKFQAEVYNSKSLEFDIRQQIKEAENKINFLLGRYPQRIVRDGSNFSNLTPALVKQGVPSALLENRPDVKQAELQLATAKLDVKIARAEFFPSLEISGALGLQAFKPSYLTKLPESILYSLAGDLAGPLLNKNAIRAEFASANARQLQALYNYQQTLLNAYFEVANQVSNIDNLSKSYDLKQQEVAALNNSINISSDLFNAARADYLEVLMTQRDALSAKLELVETKKSQFNAMVNMYKGLGGGWK